MIEGGLWPEGAPAGLGYGRGIVVRDGVWEAC